MKLSRIINYPLGLLGLKIARVSKIDPITDIQSDSDFLKVYEKIRAFTLVGIERCYALYQSMQYILRKQIPGDFVECGVWKGGSSMMMAYLMQNAGLKDRKIFLYDTYAGMTRPGEQDGKTALQEWEMLKKEKEESDWCHASLEEVKANMQATGFPAANIVYVKGKVEETLLHHRPDSIALLRLDTDWYESTRTELEILFPLVHKGGILIIDDYGAWQGARRATDEYFRDKPYHLVRIDWTGRMVIKQ